MQPHADNDLHTAQEWQYFLRILSVSGTAPNPDVVAVWRSVLPIPPKLASAASRAALFDRPASVDTERSFNIC